MPAVETLIEIVQGIQFARALHFSIPFLRPLQCQEQVGVEKMSVGQVRVQLEGSLELRIGILRAGRQVLHSGQLRPMSRYGPYVNLPESARPSTEEIFGARDTFPFKQRRRATPLVR